MGHHFGNYVSSNFFVNLRLFQNKKNYITYGPLDRSSADSYILIGCKNCGSEKETLIGRRGWGQGQRLCVREEERIMIAI